MSMPPQPPGPPTPPPGPPGPPTPPPGGGFPGGVPGGQPAGVPRPAEIVNRFLARLIDHVILGIVFVPIWIVIAVIINAALDGFAASFIANALIGVIIAAIYLAYFAYLESNRGQTVGKMIMKLRTYGPDGVSNPTMEQAAKRSCYNAAYALWIIPIVGPLFGGLAQLGLMIYIAITLNSDVPNHQGWHDKFAGGTQVKQIG